MLDLGELLTNQNFWTAITAIVALISVIIMSNTLAHQVSSERPYFEIEKP